MASARVGSPTDRRKSFHGLSALVRQALHEDPLDEIKIDRPCIRDIPDDSACDRCTQVGVALESSG